MRTSILYIYNLHPDQDCLPYHTLTYAKTSEHPGAARVGFVNVTAEQKPLVVMIQ